ncbi:MAG: hypothetical protein O8C58_01120 [Candidatus Methanoperedens sp.]|nr:hypothetical protein [Candidatus Methanoperedens sp.]
MKIKCSFCEATDKGTQDQLQDKGWSKAIFFAPIRKTIVACTLHYKEFNTEVMKIMKPKQKVSKETIKIAGTEVLTDNDIFTTGYKSP